jgi:zinc D-Ala-D-Ala carboxypeptidase
MTAPLVPVEILSIYPEHSPNKVKLPSRMAQCAPDMKKAVLGARAELEAKGITLRLSDMFRSYDMQLQAHIENAKKGVFSPLPGGSLHEAGRAFDLDLDALLKGNIIKLKDFWEIGSRHGLVPIVAAPDPGTKESWHFECRGSHAIVRQYYGEGKGGSKLKPYEAMAASSILAIGVKVDRFQNQKAAAIQGALIRLGHELGALDGSIGTRTKNALAAAGVSETNENAVLARLEEQLRAKFPGEFEG